MDAELNERTAGQNAANKKPRAGMAAGHWRGQWKSLASVTKQNQAGLEN
jgi:hypothetical protein